MKRYRYEYLLEAATAVAHHEEVYGNEALVMRRKVRQRDGGWALVPVVTGDAMRHGMREAAAYVFLDAAGLLEAGRLTEAALRLLFAGGMVTGRGDAAAVRLDQYRELCELVPSLALFGGCADNRVIPGRLTVEEATLVCEESARFLEPWVVEEALVQAGPLGSCRAHVEEVQRVRMDPVLQPAKVRLLAEGEQARVVGRLAAGERAAAEGDAVGADRAKTTMLPRRFERVVQGSLFGWATEALLGGELEVDTYHVAIAAFLVAARVGGKRATGHGLLRCVAARQVRIGTPSRDLEVLDTQALGLRVGEAFRQHVVERRERIADFLARVSA